MMSGLLTSPALEAVRHRSRWLAGFACAGALVSASVLGSSAAVDPPADLVLLGAEVYTVDPARSWAQAVAIRDGRIVAVGTNEAAQAVAGPATRVVDLRGRMVLPGFHDSHVHPIGGGVELGQCDLNGLESRDEVFERVRQYARAHPDRPWVVGGGFDLPLFPGGSPLKEDLDRLVPDRPAFLSSADGHSAWVNSRALQIAGITRDTPEPEGGRIERRADGEPSGTLRETAADLVGRHRPKLEPADYRDGLRRALDMANRFGITALIEASAEAPYLEAYQHASDAGTLTARVLVSQHVDPKEDESQVARIVARSRATTGRRLQASSAKIFIDGVIEGGTAALLEPYLDRPGDRGTLNFEPTKLARIVSALYRERIQVHVHAIGDWGIRATLDALETARRDTGWTDARPHLAHIQLFAPSDLPRFRSVGAIANFQPLWAYSDAYIKDLTEPRLGPARSQWLYPIRSVLDTGTIVVGGSDWSVSSMNPLEAMQVAVTRRALDAADGEAWIPEQRVGMADMIAAYTANGAYLRRMEHEVGSIEVGKLADLIVVDRNLFDVPLAEIHKARVQATLLEGEIIWTDGAIAGFDR